MQFLFVRHFTIFSTFHNHNAWVLPQYQNNVSLKNINLARESKLLNLHNVAELGQCSPTSLLHYMTLRKKLWSHLLDVRFT